MQGFYQSDTSRGFTQWSPLAYLINGVSHGKVSAAQEQCQGAKPVLLNVGEASLPYPWVPKVTDVGLLRLGNFVSVPKQPGKQQGLYCADSWQQDAWVAAFCPEEAACTDDVYLWPAPHIQAFNCKVNSNTMSGGTGPS